MFQATRRPARAGRRAASVLCDLLARYQNVGDRFTVCPVCFNAKHLDKSEPLPTADLAGSVQL